jgi:hypothetical protein
VIAGSLHFLPLAREDRFPVPCACEGLDREKVLKGAKMKTAIALLSTIFMLVVPVKARSESIFVAKVPSVQRIPNGEAILEFGHGPDLNGAWVSATLCNKYVDGNWAASDCRPYNHYKIRVAGLVYDRSSGAIRFRRYVCAWAEPGLVRPVYRETGQCSLHIGTIDDEFDDGFKRYRRPMDIITMQLGDPAGR